MKITAVRLGLCMVLMLCLSCPALAADIAQGKCVSYDTDKKILVIEEYDIDITAEQKYGKPTGKQLTFNLTDAVIGITPAAGDIIRIAFKAGEKENKAVRVMNVSKQDLKGK